MAFSVFDSFNNILIGPLDAETALDTQKIAPALLHVSNAFSPSERQYAEILPLDAWIQCGYRVAVMLEVRRTTPNPFVPIIELPTLVGFIRELPHSLFGDDLLSLIFAHCEATDPNNPILQELRREQAEKITTEKTGAAAPRRVLDRTPEVAKPARCGGNCKCASASDEAAEARIRAARAEGYRKCE